MQLIRDIKTKSAPTALVIGNFDGLHLGHQAIIQQIVMQAKTSDLIPAVMTFHPHPRAYFQKTPFYRLSTFAEKLSILKDFGIAQVFCLRFHENLAKLSAKEFITKYLVEHCNVRYLLLGEDFRFGYEREGSFALLQEVSQTCNFKVEAIALKETAGQKISSSRVREAMLAGNFKEVKALLGRSYTLQTRVIKGRAQGRLLGFPTANLKMPVDKVPFKGVFTTLAKVEDKTYAAVTNVGTRPTLDGKNYLTEVHLLDFKGDLYGKRLQVSFLEKIRDEMKFANVEALKAQIAKDVEMAREYFKKIRLNMKVDIL